MVRWRMLSIGTLTFAWTLLLASCGGFQEGGSFLQTPGSLSEANRTEEATRPPATIPLPAPTDTPPAPPTTTALPEPTQTSQPGPQVCSPLEGIALPDLAETIVNPYHPPPPGSDDPHEGIDIAYTLPDSRIAVAGGPVYAALAGRVAAVIRDRFPYGNAVIVETAFAALPSQIPDLPGPVTPEVRSALTCPDVEVELPEGAERSLYSVYAHLESPPEFHWGDEIACGASLGTVGSSGNALNPHLHIEMRTGPAGARFESMAHYDASASELEMAAYCLWRISGQFALLDPMSVLSQFEDSTDQSITDS